MQFQRSWILRAAMVLTITLSTFSLTRSAVAHSGCGPAGVPQRWYAAGAKGGVTDYGGFYETHEQNYVVANPGAGGWVVNRLLVGMNNPNSWIEVGYGWGWCGENIPHFYVGHGHVPDLLYMAAGLGHATCSCTC